MRPLSITLAFILLIIGAILTFRELHPNSPTADPQAPSTAIPSSRSARPEISPESSLQFFKSLSTHNPNQAPTFSQVEDRARHLTDDQLLEAINLTELTEDKKQSLHDNLSNKFQPASQ